ncbi:MAG: T9SS type A sorting domain-containing protein [Bacteroidetes bacterium]|nr:T9SS type A sorting domain-containing protein [Bacteroidota bacterium]
MKKTLLALSALLMFCGSIYAQASFNTGGLMLEINQYGRIRLDIPNNIDTITHLERASILVGTSTNAVFDYTNDAEEHEPTDLVASPLSSDFEIYGSYDNTYSGAPPDVIVKLNAYGWTNGSFIITKFNVINNESLLMNARIGLDIIPELNGVYGFDSVTYNPSAGVIRFHRGDQENLGIKLLSGSLSSLASFEWYDGYTYDSIYWQWMNYGSLQPQYASPTADGPVCITSEAGKSINAGDSTEVFYAFAFGADETSMLANMQAAVDKYNLLFTSVGEAIPAGNGLILGKNFPNPCNENTKINYELPSQGMVSLKLYDAQGNIAAALVNAKQDKGMHSVEFDTRHLAPGVYCYTINFNNQVKSQNMLVVR